jgi:hypothetical protein
MGKFISGAFPEGASLEGHLGSCHCLGYDGDNMAIR